MQRRTLLKLGAGASVALLLVGGGLALVEPGLRQGRLTAAGRTVFAAVARAVLDGSLPADAAARDAALHAQLLRLNEALSGFSAPVQAELSQLLAILASAPGRIAFAGLSEPWPQASVAQIQTALQGMRVSAISLREQAYHALRDLTNAAYFSDPRTWSLLGYSGPVAIGMP